MCTPIVTRPSPPSGPSRRRARAAPLAIGASALAIAVALHAPVARAEATAPPSPLGPSSSPGTPDDTRFSAIGRSAAAEAGGLRPAIGASATQVGHVTWAGLRADVPVHPRWSIIPQAALLRVSPYRPDDPVTVNTYVGGGVGLRPARGVSLEVSALYGPRANQLSSLGFALVTSLELLRARDDEGDLPPRVALEIALAGTRFDWANGLGPAGSSLTQAYAQAQLPIRLGRRVVLTPRGMYFLYDRTLDEARGERLGSVSTLARIGSYAPRWMAGGRLGYAITRWLTPFVEAESIGYAAGIGHATKLDAGVRATLGARGAIAAYGGAIVNRVGGPLVPADFDLRTVPLVGLELELRL